MRSLIVFLIFALPSLVVAKNDKLKIYFTKDEFAEKPEWSVLKVEDGKLVDGSLKKFIQAGYGEENDSGGCYDGSKKDFCAFMDEVADYANKHVDEAKSIKKEYHYKAECEEFKGTKYDTRPDAMQVYIRSKELRTLKTPHYFEKCPNGPDDKE